MLKVCLLFIISVFLQGAVDLVATAFTFSQNATILTAYLAGGLSVFHLKWLYS